MKIIFAALVSISFAIVAQAQVTSLSAENIRTTERTVKNAPFSAEAVSESVQILTDGNRIVRRTTTRLFRDNEGRSRREDMPRQIGVPGAVVDMPSAITIIDPIAGARFAINPKENTARLTTFKSEAILEAEQKARMAERDAQMKIRMAEREAMKERMEKLYIDPEKGGVGTQIAGSSRVVIDPEAVDALRGMKVAIPTPPVKVAPDMERKKEDPNIKIQNLGIQNIDGVEAEGTRKTTTIPAGAIGNERPIEVVYERWYSKELQMIVSSKNTDPRFGEQTYRLVNLTRADPPSTLFSPPAEYRIIDQSHPQVKPMTFPKPSSSITKLPAPTTVPVGTRRPGGH